MRTFLCAALALALIACTAFAEEGGKKKKKKRGKGNTGTIVKVDPTAGTLTVSVKRKKTTEEKEFKVTDKTTVTEIKGDETTEIKADTVANLLKKEQFKEGAVVTVQTDEDGKTAKSITFGKKQRKKKKNDS